MGKASDQALTYTPHQLPSQAIVTGRDQFIFLTVRSGNAALGYVHPEISSVIREVLKLQKRLRSDEFLKIRGVWFNDTSGGYVVYVDLIHDRTLKPSITATKVRRALHDGEVWPEGQCITVGVRFVPESTASDHFFPITDKYYLGLAWQDGLRGPLDQSHSSLGEWKMDEED